MKEIGYIIFACFYKFFSILPMKKNHVFLIMTHDESREGNVGRVGYYMKKYESSKIYTLKRKDTSVKRMPYFFLVKSYELARCEYVFLDNAFLPMAYFKVRKGTKVVQLWHGTGTIKKFGQHVNKGTRLGELENRSHKNITKLVVNSEATKKLYSQCFGIPESKVEVLGLPRTDYLFKKEYQNRQIHLFYGKYPMLQDKKLLLYTPTFRDDQVELPQIKLNIKKLIAETDDSVCLGLRLHPFIADKMTFSKKEYGDRVYDFSKYPHLNTLLFVSDVLMTDYSSIVFEYCALKKPMIFFAYDLEKFSQNGRGFYEDYETYVPGPVARTTEEVIDILNENQFKYEKIEPFFHTAYKYEDGKSTKRVVKMIKEVDARL